MGETGDARAVDSFTGRGQTHERSTDVEIAGAYQHPHHDYWLLYVTLLRADVAEVEFRAGYLRLFSREEARLWVDMLAHLFVKSSDSRRHPMVRQLEAASA